MESHKDKFERFHKDNPRIYELYKLFALQAVLAGKKTLSISLLTERIRWETSVVTRSDDGFKISNNHRAFYARMLNEEIEFKDMFVIKAQQAASVY